MPINSLKIESTYNIVNFMVYRKLIHKYSLKTNWFCVKINLVIVFHDAGSLLLKTVGNCDLSNAPTFPPKKDAKV